MRKIRVLIVDDSTVIRRLLTSALSSDPEIEVVGTAPNGKIAIAKLSQLTPDVVTLDIEMPEMDGLATVLELRKLYPTLPVIMFSTLTQKGAEATLDALANGANDYVTKPANVGSVNEAMQSVREQLIPKIKSLCKWYNEKSQVESSIAKKPQTPVQSFAPRSPRGKNRIDIVTIGSSTGGPNALMAVLKELPQSFPVPILVVQHMPPVFTKHLANRLNQNCALEVVEANPGVVIRSGMVAIAPGDYHMTVRLDRAGVRMEMNQKPPENSCRPSVDVLFRSVAENFGANTLAVVLTGMGRDGKLGAEMIRDAGGRIFAQDEASSVVWGMPRAIVQSGLADEVLPLSRVAEQLMSAMAVGRSTRMLTKA
jgi:two-component system, chemotaxis family, protein-glutamate methylesterase/glutaminase